ncbi:MAG: MBG domain-containing protein [Erysipelotrichaceae bacterium]|nr:MBG domain-containing protein [Erysipelotrichaceae bacterium]
MNKKYKKQAKVAMAVALATTSVASSAGNVFAQKESEADIYNSVDTKELNEEQEELSLDEVVEEEQLKELNEVLEVEDAVQESSKEERATGDVVINSTNFPDETFREYISNNFDSDGDGVLSIAELEAVTQINVKGMQEITSLEGIGYFVALDTLHCSSTSITNLDLSKNRRLNAVYCSNTPLTNIDISKNNLLLLEMNNNEELTNIDVSNNRSLRWFYIRNNKISNLDVSMLTRLVTLNCGKTQITNLDISNNPILEVLAFDNTAITDIDTSQNPELQYLSCYESSIKNLDVSNNSELGILLCNNTSITNLDVRNNLRLTELNCAFTSITDLDVSNNTLLRELRCNNTQVPSLDLSNHRRLELLNCEFTPITNLDVSQSPNLRDLNCNNTGLMGLDVSNNRVLLNFKCLNNQLAWLHIGDHDSIYAVQKSDSVIDIGEIDITFNIQERFPGIDPNRILSIEGAEIDKATGIVSKYNNGVPISYVYDCGISYFKTEKLNVTLNFTKILRDSTITINSVLNKVYDGQPMADPTNIVKTGSSGDVTFEWFRKDGRGQWVSLGNQAPVNAGEYGVKAHLAADQNYAGADSGEPTPFTITQEVSSITINSYNGKEYDGTPVSNPTNISKTGSDGAVTFEWFRKTADGNWESLGEEAPTNAGEYGVKAHLAADQNYAGADSGEPTPFTITQAVSSITINSYKGKEYDGTPVSNPTDIRRTDNNATVTFKYYRVDGITEIAAPSEVGSYKVKAFLSGDANYVDSESNFVDFSIVAASTTINLTYEDQIYTGNPVANPQYTVEGSTGAVTIEWYEANDLTTPLTQAPTNVGSYVVKVVVAGTSTHDGASATASFEITPATSTISINRYDGKMYDGTPVSNPTDIATAGSDGAVTFEWFVKTEDGNWAPLEQAPVNVGNYGVKAHLAANQNYTAADSGEPTPFEITQATSSISINSYDGKVYDGNPVSDPTDITRTQNTATVTFKYYRADDTTTEIPAPSEVGAYKVKAFLSGDANYTDSESNFFDFNIAALGTTITLTYGNQVYTGNPVADPQYTVEGSTGAVTIEWYEASDLTTPLTQAPTNVGSYVVKVSVAGTDTHTGASKMVSFEITKATSTISIHNYEGKVYDGTPISNPTDIRVKGSTGAVTIEWYKEDGTKLEGAPMNAGSYKVKAILAGDANYEGAETEQEIIISKVPNAWTTELSIHDWVYGEEANTPQAESQFGTVTYTYSTSEDGVYTDTVPSDAGTYWVKATVEATDNYEGLEAKVSFMIDKANSSITIDTNLNKEYDGQPVNSPAITQVGSQSTPVYEWYVKNEGTVRTDTWTKLAEAPVEVGNYKLVVSVAEDINYYGAMAEVEFSIKAAQSESIPTPGEDSNVEPEDTIEGVQTGDTTQVGLWTVLAGLAAGIMVFFTNKKRKEEK